jgi:hypothetical protein
MEQQPLADMTAALARIKENLDDAQIARIWLRTLIELSNETLVRLEKES